MSDDFINYNSSNYKSNRNDREPERDRKRKSKSRDRSPNSSYKKRRYDDEREDNYNNNRSSNNYRRNDNRRDYHNNNRDDRRGGNNRGRYSKGGNKYSNNNRNRNSTSNFDIYEGPLKVYELYMSFQGDEISTEESHKRYKEYKEEYMRRMSINFFRNNKDKEWFRERYEPNYLVKTYNDLIEKIKNNASDFNKEIEENRLAVPPLDFDRYIEFYKQNFSEEYQKTQEISEVENYEDDSNQLDILLQNPEPSIETPPGETQTINILAHPPHTLFISTVHPNCYKDEVFRFLNSVEEAPLLRLTLSNPTEKRGWTRQGWASYATEEQASLVLKILNEREIRSGYKISLVHYVPKIRPVKQANPVFASPERISKDIKQSLILISRLDSLRNTYEENQNPVLVRRETDSDADFLDRLIYYLRRVHYFCYYSLKEFTDEEELVCNTGKVFIRSSPKQEEIPTSNKITETFDNNFYFKIDHLKNPFVITGKKTTEEITSMFLEDNINKMAEEKYKCRLCTKAFKAVGFIQKHLTTRHPEILAKSIDNAMSKQFSENYLNDPERPNNTPSIAQPVPRVPSPKPVSNYQNKNNRKSYQNHYVEEEEDEIDPREPFDYVELDSAVQGVPNLDYYLGIKI